MNSMSTTEQSVDLERYLCFSLGEEEYGMPLLAVREVIAMPEITPVPYSASHFLGIMNLRGKVISIIDFRTKLGIKPAKNSETAVIICDLHEISLGVVVDSVNYVVTPQMNEISDRPEIQASKSSEYITKVFRKKDALILLIDIEKALGVDSISAASQAVRKAA